MALLSRGKLTYRQKWMLLLMIILPLALMVGKWPTLPTSGLLLEFVSLIGISPDMQDRIIYILIVPTGAVVVVFIRLTLGLRVLGPFRSILLAMAFLITGIVPGLLFSTAIVAIVLAVRPLLKDIGLPYFGRVSVMLSMVAVIITAVILVGPRLGVEVLKFTAFFPVFVLCLICEAFARTISKEGISSAIWRGLMTALAAVIIALIAGIPQIGPILLRHPELLIAQIGVIIAISEFFNLRLLDFLNPSHDGAGTIQTTENQEADSEEEIHLDDTGGGLNR